MLLTTGLTSVFPMALNMLHYKLTPNLLHVFRFVVSNGKTSRNGSVEVLVEMVDRVLPSLVANKGLTVPQGSAMILGPDCLSLSDPDTPPSALTFILRQPPQYGSLVLAGSTLTAGSSFTQRDIKKLELTYKHNGGPSQIDRFAFTAADSSARGFLLDERLQTDPVFFTIQVGDHECCYRYSHCSFGNRKILISSHS